jgi:hypothetical protein
VTCYDRAQAARRGQTPYADLSSAHYGGVASTGEPIGIRCIDGHRGNGGLIHRAVTLTLGARDTWIWITGQSDPTIEKTELFVPVLLTAARIECHADVLLVMGFNNHFHNRLPEAYRAWLAGDALRLPEDQAGSPEAALRVEPSRRQSCASTAIAPTSTHPGPRCSLIWTSTAGSTRPAFSVTRTPGVGRSSWLARGSRRGDGMRRGVIE